MCRHILLSLEDREPVGFHWPANSDEDRPNAWCSACDDLERGHDGEWSEDSLEVVGISLVCGDCYDEAKRLNIAWPPID